MCAVRPTNSDPMAPRDEIKGGAEVTRVVLRSLAISRSCDAAVRFHHPFTPAVPVICSRLLIFFQRSVVMRRWCDAAIDSRHPPLELRTLERFIIMSKLAHGPEPAELSRAFEAKSAPGFAPDHAHALIGALFSLGESFSSDFNSSSVQTKYVINTLNGYPQRID
jgi:hypothetical protein